MGVQEHGFIIEGVRTIFSFLDRVVYGLIKWILFGIFDLANLTTNSSVFSGIYSRIYVILGIFMAFKLSFAFFQYIIDPESMTGKSDKSISKVFTRVFVMLAALMFLPAVLFGQDGKEGLLSRAQKAFLPSLPKLIFGVNDLGGLSSGNSSNKFSDSIEQSANDIAVSTLSGFFYPPEELDAACGDGTYEKTPKIETIEDFVNDVHITCNKKGDIVIGGNFLHTGTKFYKYSYMWFVSTVVGVLVAVLLLGITLDIAKRIFKLMVLEAIAPIPIMSLIDPKGSKDGAFGKWTKSLISTFIDIFLKMGLVYLVIVFIHLIVNSGKDGGLFTNFPQDTGFRGTYLIILLILGLIFFAKEAPKFIKDALGMKDSGGGLFDDVKSIGKAAGLVGGAAVGTAGVIGSTVGNIKAQHEGNQEYFKGQHVRNAARNLAAGISGFAGGTAAAVSGLTGKDGGLKSVMKKQQERNANSFDYRRNGGTLFGRAGAGIGRTFTGETPATKYGREVAAMENEQSLIKAITERASGEMVKSTSTRGSFGSLNGSYNYKSVKAAMDAASASGEDKFKAMNFETGVEETISMTDAYMNIGGLLKTNEEDYLKRANVDGSGIVDTKLASLQENARKGGVKAELNSREKLKGRLDQIDIDKVSTKQKQTRAQANDRYSSKKK